MHAFDRQTDGQTDRRTEISSLRPRCIPCSAVKSIRPNVGILACVIEVETVRHQCRSILKTLRHWYRTVRTLRHQSDSAEMSWVRSVLGPKCLDTIKINKTHHANGKSSDDIRHAIYLRQQSPANGPTENTRIPERTISHPENVTR